MGGVHRPADEDVDVGRLVQQHLGDLGRGILVVSPIGRQRPCDHLVRQFHDFAHCNDTLGHQVDPFHMPGRRDMRVEIVQAGFDRLAKIFADNLRGCAAADNLLAGFGKEFLDYRDIVLRVGRRPQDNRQLAPLPDLHDRDGRVVPHPPEVKLLRGLSQFGRHRMG